ASRLSSSRTRSSSDASPVRLCLRQKASSHSSGSPQAVTGPGLTRFERRIMRVYLARSLRSESESDRNRILERVLRIGVQRNPIVGEQVEVRAGRTKTIRTAAEYDVRGDLAKVDASVASDRQAAVGICASFAAGKLRHRRHSGIERGDDPGVGL